MIVQGKRQIRLVTYAPPAIVQKLDKLRDGKTRYRILKEMVTEFVKRSEGNSAPIEGIEGGGTSQDDSGQNRPIERGDFGIEEDLTVENGDNDDPDPFED